MEALKKLTDSYRHKGMRKNLVKDVRAKGITDENVLKALEKVPRHFFLDDAFLEIAYEDRAFSIGEGQTISQPYTVAYQTELLHIKKNDKVLEIGTGSGYQTCVLLEMGAKVYTIERIKALHDKAKQLLPRMGYHARFFYGDGTKGLKAYAPYDKIIVTAGAPVVPEALLSQLSIGGILVIPVGDDKIQTMLCIQRTGENEYNRLELDTFRFVPLIGDEGWK